MDINQPLISEDFEVDLAFKSISPEKINENIDLISRDLLTNIDRWSNTFESWIKCIRKDSTLTCPSIVRTNSRLSLGLIFTDDLFISKLNYQWRKKNVATDVLSFPALDANLIAPLDQFVELGDIIVSVETAFKQAKSHNHSLAHELRWLVSHGFLHLLGWDHPSSSTLDSMLSFQEQLLKEQAFSSLRNTPGI